MTTEHENRQLGGYKATLHNPNTSEEAKAHAAEVLKEHGHTVDGAQGESEHDHRVLGGYKATLHNPNTSAEAKSHAADVLAEHGVVVDTGAKENGHAHATRSHDAHTPQHAGQESASFEHEHRVLGGYKATVHNPNASTEAKENAQRILAEHGEAAE
ncbi:hypothetical protein IAU60_003288 [Kwoniella sp. DSM 27419]